MMLFQGRMEGWMDEQRGGMYAWTMSHRWMGGRINGRVDG